MITLRPFNFTDEDYAAIANIYDAAWFDSKMRAKDFKNVDGRTPAEEYDWERTVAELDGVPVGFGIYTRALWLATPDLYAVNWITHPDYRGRGIGSAYWTFLNRDILPSRTISGLRTTTRSDAPDSITFLEKRKFALTIRHTRSALDLQTFDPMRFEKQRRAIEVRGIEIKPLSKLMKSDANYLEKLMRLEFVLLHDEPHDEPPKPRSADEFKKYYMSSDLFYPEGWFIAVDGEKFVGWSAVLPNLKRPNEMSNGITVIDRAYRRIGLATMMKSHALQHAKSRGAQRIVAGNAATNPMLQINFRLGFERLYDELTYMKAL